MSKKIATRKKARPAAKKAASTKAGAAPNAATRLSSVKTTPAAQRYILLPANQMQAAPGTGNPDVAEFLVGLSRNVTEKAGLRLEVKSGSTKKNTSININVVDSIHENGAKLVAIDDAAMADFRFSYPGLRIIPEKFYQLTFRQEPVKTRVSVSSSGRAAVGFKSQLKFTDKAGKPLAGIYAVAFTDFANRVGASGKSTAAGIINLTLNSKKIERLYVYPDHSYWGFFRKSFTLAANYTIALNPLTPGFTDGLRHFYPSKNWPAITTKVRVGIIDTGFGPHKDVIVKSAINMVLNADPNDFADAEGHGTHVAGIIGAHGDFPGVATGVEIYVYRVFPGNGDGASNYDIMKAIDRAKQDQCDLVNMSLGGGGLDEGVVSSIKDAYSEGLLCFVANGNDNRSKVSFPAAYSLCIAVSAMGRKGTFPASTVQTASVKAPFGTDKNNFIADFSNIGPETDLTGPGVGIISTFPVDKYAVMDGTSMACPAETGMAARLLSTRPDILAMPRTPARTDAMQKFLSTKVQSLGFGANFEGKGILVP